MKLTRWMVGLFVFSAWMCTARAEPVTVAVMVPDSVAGSGAEVTDILLAELSASPDILLVDHSQLRTIMAEQYIADQDLLEPATATRLGKLLGAQYLGAAQVRHRTETGCRAFLHMTDTATGMLKVGYEDLVDCDAPHMGQALAEKTMALIDLLEQAQPAPPAQPEADTP